MKEVYDILDNVLAMQHVGSRVTCDPPPTDTDDDWLVLISNSLDGRVDSAMTNAGYSIGGSVIQDDARTNFFWSYTKDDVNIIIIDRREFFEKFMLATAVSKKLNLMDKKDRITLFQAILYGNEYG